MDLGGAAASSATTATTTATAASNSAATAAATSSGGAKRLDAIKLAKASKWEELKRLVDAEPLMAQQTDSYAMLPLHWACTDPGAVSDAVLMALLKAFPQGARSVNTAEMLPLQIAIKAQAKIEWLQALLASFPEAVLKKTPTGEHAVELARQAGLPPRSVRLLEEMYLHVCQKAGYSSDHLYDDESAAPGGGEMSFSDPMAAGLRAVDAAQAMALAAAAAASASSSRGAARRPSQSDAFKSRAYSDMSEMLHHDPSMAFREQPSFMRGMSTSSNGSGGSLSTANMGGGGGGGGIPLAKPLPYQVSTQLSSRTVVSLPPRWTNAPNCHICSQKWSTFRKRHHCRNCGQSICGDHSARERMRLPHYGLPDRYRVCTVCHQQLRNAAREMLQPSQARLTAASMASMASAMPSRRSDEALGPAARGSAGHAAAMMGGGGAPPMGNFQLERHVSAPARPMMNPAEYHGIHDQVASLQMQVSQLLEQKELAESQLRAQAELLGESYQNEQRLTTGSRGSNGSGSGGGGGGGGGSGGGGAPGRRDRLNSVPIKLPSTHQANGNGNTASTMGTYGSYDMGSRLTRSTASSDREVDIDYGALSMSSAVPEPPTSSESGTTDLMARLQEDLGSMSFVSSYSEFDDRSTEYYDDDPTRSQSVLEEGDEDDEENDVEGDDDDDDDDDDVGDSTLPEVEVLVNLGLSMLNKGSCSAAVQAFTRAVEICPDTAVLYSYLAKAHYADDNLDDAVLALEKSLALEPSAANSTLLGKILFEKGDHEKAIEAYQKSLEFQNGS